MNLYQEVALSFTKVGDPWYTSCFAYLRRSVVHEHVSHTFIEHLAPPFRHALLLLHNYSMSTTGIAQLCFAP